MNGKVIVIVVAALVVLGSVVAQLIDRTDDRNAPPHPPVFAADTSFESAKAQAAQADRLFIVDMMAEWCGPCKEMDKTSWINDQVVAWVGAHAIAVQVDIDERRSLAQGFGITGVPTILVFDGTTGAELGRSIGYLGPDKLLNWLESVRAASEQAPADNDDGG